MPQKQPSPGKTCKACGGVEPLWQFRSTRNFCRICESNAANARQTKRRREDPEWARGIYAKWTEWFHQNREAVLRGNRERTARDPKKYQAFARRWVAANPLRAKAAQKRYQAKIRNAMGRGVSGNDWVDILEQYNNRCGYCLAELDPKLLTLDHFRPISKGGEHDPDNAIPACFTCNCRKNAGLVFDWVPRMGPNAEVSRTG